MSTILVGASSLLLGACSEIEFGKSVAQVLVSELQDRRGSSPRPSYRVGSPFRISGTIYYPAEDYSYSETGIATWYRRESSEKRTANGELFDSERLSAAHRTLPMPSLVVVTNLSNGRSLRLRVNDRGPLDKGRLIAVSQASARILGFEKSGTAPVRVEIVEDASRRLKKQMLAGNAEAARGSPGNRFGTPLTSRFPDVEAGSKQGSRIVEAVRSADSDRASEAREGQGSQTEMFVRVGNLVEPESASRLQVELSAFGPAHIVRDTVRGHQYYRVRIGPLPDLDAADSMLASLNGAGYHQARIIVD